MGFALHRGTTDIDTDLTVVDGGAVLRSCGWRCYRRNSHTPVYRAGAFSLFLRIRY